MTIFIVMAFDSRDGMRSTVMSVHRTLEAAYKKITHYEALQRYENLSFTVTERELDEDE